MLRESGEYGCGINKSMQNILVDKDEPLWELKGPGWSFPILVEWPETNDMAAITIHPEVPIIRKHKEAVISRLKEYGYELDGKFWVLGYKLNQIARQSIGAEPEDLVEWVSQPHLNSNTELSEEMREFIDSFCRLGWSSHPGKMKVMFAALCKHMLDWILVKNRVLDLGFAELSAPPYTADWKNQFIRRWVHRSEGNIKKMVRRIDGTSRKIEEELVKPEYAGGMIGGKICMRRIEVTHKMSWWKTHIRNEKLRKPSEYWNEVKKLMRDHAKQATKCVLAYAHEVLAPIPFVTKKGAPRRKGIPANWSPVEGGIIEISLGDQVCAIAIRDQEMRRHGEPLDMDAEEEEVW